MYEYFCPQCGKMTRNPAKAMCENCKSITTPTRMRHEVIWYQEEAKKSLNDKDKENPSIWLPIFTRLMHDEIKAYLAENGGTYKEYKPHIVTYQEAEARKNIPRCPVCQSTNIEKISAGKRVLHGYAFGLFGKTARSQFECKACGYKF